MYKQFTHCRGALFRVQGTKKFTGSRCNRKFLSVAYLCSSARNEAEGAHGMEWRRQKAPAMQGMGKEQSILQLLGLGGAQRETYCDQLLFKQPKMISYVHVYWSLSVNTSF